MRAAFLVHVPAAEPGESQADSRHGLTNMNVDEPDDLDDDDEDEDDDFLDDEEDDGEGEEDGSEDDEDDDEPETWQVAARYSNFSPICFSNVSNT